MFRGERYLCRKIAPEFYFIGNHPALDFVNTKIVVNAQPLDLLDTFDSLMDWMVKANLLSETERNLRKAVYNGNEEEARIVESARLLRDHIFHLIQPGSANEGSTEASLQFINGAEGANHAHRACGRRRIQPQKPDAFRKPLDLLSPIAASAVDF